MTASLSVYLTERAPAARAQWLQRMLEPVAAACKFITLPPIECRPTGKWAGWCEDADSTPDGRVILSNKIVFWTAQETIGVYLHESAHRLLQGQKVESHGPEFCCVLAILLWRAQDFFEHGAWSCLKLYNISDRPEGLEEVECWHGTVLNWLLKNAADLGDSDISAEKLAPLVCERWQTFLIERQAGRDAAAKAADGAMKQREQQAQQVAELNDSLMLWRWSAGLGWLFFGGLAWWLL